MFALCMVFFGVLNGLNRVLVHALETTLALIMREMLRVGVLL